MTQREHDHRGEHEDVVARLRAARDELSPLELDELRGRVLARPNRTRRTSLMKSRMAITMLLVLGLVLSTAGAGLAIESGSDPAAIQYNTDDSGVLGQTDTAADPQAPRQLAAEQGDELPFTGFFAIPLLIGGVALLSVGLVLRRRT